MKVEAIFSKFLALLRENLLTFDLWAEVVFVFASTVAKVMMDMSEGF